MNTTEIDALIDRWCSRVDAVSDASGATEDGNVPLVKFENASTYTSASNEDLMVYLLTTARETGRFGRLVQVCASLYKAYGAILEECRACYMNSTNAKKYVKDDMVVWLQSHVRKFSQLQANYTSKLLPIQGQIDGIAKECETMYKALSRIVELKKNQMGPSADPPSRRSVRRE